MEDQKEDYYSIKDIREKFGGLVRYLLRKWWLLVLGAVLGGGLGMAYYHMQKPKYEAVCTFILEEKQGGMGGLSSIASQFGVDFGGLSSGGGLFAGDNILDILTSRKVVQQVLLTPAAEDTANAGTLADLYLDFSKLKNGWQQKPMLASINFSKADPNHLTSVEDSVMNIIHSRVVKKHLLADRISKKGTIIKVQVTAANSLFARLMTERLVSEAARMYLEVKTGTAQANISRMQRRSDSLLYLLNRKSFAVAATQPLDANPGIKTAAVPVEIAARDKTVIATLYTEVTKNLEASKLLLSQQTPVIQLLDRPGPSLYDNKKSLFILVVAGGFICFAICVAMAAAVYLIK